MAHELTEDQLQELREGFDSVDEDGGGSLSPQEVLKFLRQVGRDASIEEVTSLIREVDTDGNGFIEFEEFCIIMARQMRASDPEEELRWAFGLLDPHKTGHLTPEVLVDTFLAELGESLAIEEARALLEAADFDGDGKVSWEDFVKLVR